MSVDATTPIDLTEVQPDEAVAEVAEAERSGRHLSLWNYPATYTLLGINLVIFAIMFGSGLAQELWHARAWTQLLTASFDIDTLQRFGATDGALILQYNQWWRLVTGTFVHVTMLHVLLNMWCLVEPGALRRAAAGAAWAGCGLPADRHGGDAAVADRGPAAGAAGCRRRGRRDLCLDWRGY